ncbi:angiotensin-converting enzyme-related protein-like [Musca vetustissima]|uniref:angiotensin-converting enzyme-related protein-like n=1 Tax=Musca vetustissima TaxID=27455 RepID=UPI002AB72408|nr:angiotensin-converting enzyme-related protein-like [Musca vetustissima]
MKSNRGLPVMWLGGFITLCLTGSMLFDLVKADSTTPDTCSGDFPEVREFFQREGELLRQRRREEFLAAWEYNTNVTEENRLNMIAVSARNAVENLKAAQLVRQKHYRDLSDPCLKRLAEYAGEIGAEILSPEDLNVLLNAVSSMQSNYASTKVCSYKDPKDCSLTLEPHVQERLSKSRDPKELAHYWKEWYDKAGTPMRDNFAKYVELSNKAAKLNNFTSAAEYWIHMYEDPEFEKNLDSVYQAILPLYRELHGYVRQRLSQHYGKEVVSPNGNLPMHLLGNMWGQQWDEIIDLLKPYPNKEFVDVTSEMKKQKYTVEKLFELGDEFFKSLGMSALPQSFWNLSVIEKPADRTIVCHASAWDFFQDSDVRIKMCTEVDTHYLYVVHHELGHIQYYLQYEKQPTVFRGAPNPGFHEAVGDVIALSVSSAKHLNTIGLSPETELDEESRINELFRTSLKKIVFLPFAYTMDKYRYAVFRNEIDEHNWNCAFWQMRSEYTGIEPPVYRNDSDFDPPAKYHVSADVEYLRYFAAHIFQFQFHKAMCTKAGQYVKGDREKTLDNCDIYKSKEAGSAFSRFLSAGASRHWTEVLKEFTGDSTMDPSALLEYFEPLRVWLKEENRKQNVPVGWGLTDNLSEKDMVSGMKLSDSLVVDPCKTCMAEKIHVTPFPKHDE